jgi:hypothetical protein
MRASVGDRIVIHGHHIGEPDRDGEVLEIGDQGGPPYLLRWADTGHETLFFPGPDATIQHFEHTPDDGSSSTARGWQSGTGVEGR